MKKNTVRYLLAGFGLSLILLLISTVVSFVAIKRLISSSETVNQSNVISLELENIISNMKDAETGFRGYLLTRDSAFLEPYKGAYNRTTESLIKVKGLTIDNKVQQQYLTQLEPVIESRFRLFREGLILAANGKLENSFLNNGRNEMDKARLLINGLEREEKKLVTNQNQRLQKYINYTPSLVVVAAGLFFLIAGFSFIRIRDDSRKQEALQVQLERSSESVKQRVMFIADVAEKISAGNYTSRVDASDAGELGSLANALNKMADDLQVNFANLDSQAWLQNGVLELNDQLKGENSPAELSQQVLTEIIHYLQAQLGILYLVPEGGNYLQPVAAYGCTLKSDKQICFGEGLVGQAAKDQKPLFLSKVPYDLFRIHSGLLTGPPGHVIIYPLVFNRVLLGVLEIGSIQPFPVAVPQYLKIIGANTALALNTAHNRLRVNELLQKTQTLSEELQVQQDELQRSNVDLEMQTQMLQASEEELRVQQEELMQSNQELEEKAQLLEEKNQFIVQKSKELSQLNDEVEIKNTELKQASKYKSEFLANMSHELRTPLNSILLLAKLLSESKDLELGDDRYEYARVIHGSGLGLLDLINEILDLSKIEAGQMQIFVEEVPFAAIRKDLADMFNPLANEKGLELNFDFSSELPEFLTSDKQRLEQILKNLLSNAIKFTQKGQVTLTVQAGTPTSFKLNKDKFHYEQVIAFSVKDSGIGIPQDSQALVFEAFKQVDGTTRRKFGGTGLGLSISQELAKLLGGEISLISEPDKGSEFIVYLPLTWEEPVIAPETVLPDAASQAAPVLQIQQYIPEPRNFIPMVPDDRDQLEVREKAILIVEDDIDFVKALVPFVKAKGYKVLVATRGDEGVSLAKQFKPFGILLDINLPVMDGWTVMEHLKQDPATRHIPVHTMSSEEARQKSLLYGAIDFINKPLAQIALDGILQKMKAVEEKSTRLLLIIEENPRHSAAISDYFGHHGISTATASNGEAGVVLLQKESFDGVILDMTLNEKLAYSILDHIKANKKFQTLPIIVYTGQSLLLEDENRINSYATTSIVKKANTYEKVLNEVSIFLHLVAGEEPDKKEQKKRNKLLDRDLVGKTILLADDDERNIYSMTKLLEMQGVKVITAANGREVVELLRDSPLLDGILMDMMMPEMDGYETTAYIRQQPAYKNIPVIAVTAKTMPHDRHKCIEAGASDYIAKPVDLDQLLSLLRVWLY